jgi:sugar phosphate isomerase/epimerase
MRSALVRDDSASPSLLSPQLASHKTNRGTMDRRNFLATIGAAGAGAMLPSLGGCAGNNGSDTTRATTTSTASAGGAVAPTARPAPGVQLYTLRTEMAKDVDATLMRLGSLGYREVEFAGYFNRTPSQIKDSLSKAGLTAPSAHIPIEVLDGNQRDRALADAVAVGHQWVVVPWLAADIRRSLDDYRKIAERLNRIGEAAQKAGLQFAYHNHDFEITPLEGRVPLEVMLESTDPKRVAVELDVYWTVKAGGDPLAYYAKWPGRITMLHLKDSKGAPAHEMTEVGSGTIDWNTIIARGTQQGGVRHAFIEHDNPADPWASVTASIGHLKTLAG